MAKRPRDPGTPDLFRDYQPAPVVARFADDQVRAWSLPGRLSKAVAAALDACGMSRAEVARRMSEYLQEEVSKAMLDNYASQAKDHDISGPRLAALVKVTGDPRVLNALLADMGMIVVPAKYEPLLRREQAKEQLERVQRELDAAEAEWRAKR